MLYTGLLWRPLRTDPGRTALTVLAVALGISVVVAIRMANRSALASFAETTHALAGRADLVATGPVPIPATLLAKLRPLAAEADVSPYLDRMAFDPRSREPLEVFGVDFLSNAAHREALRGALKINPRAMAASAAAKGIPIILTAAYARRWGYRAGETMVLSSGGLEHRFHIVALLPDRGVARAQAGNIALLNLPDAISIFEFQGGAGENPGSGGWSREPQFPLSRVRFDGLQITLAPGARAAAVKARLQPLLPSGDRVETPATRSNSSDRMLAAFRANLSALSYISLLVGVFLIYNTVSMAVVRRRVAIATARALGATRGAILRLFFAEALLLSLAGGVLGIGLGWALAGATLRLISLTINSLYAVTHPSPPRLLAGDVAWAMGLALLSGLVSALAPARQAAAIAPAEGTREGAQETRWLARKSRFLLGAAAMGAAAVVFAHLPEPGGLPVFGYASALAALLGCALGVPPLLAVLLPWIRSVMLRRGWISTGLAAASLAGSLRRSSVLLIALSTAVGMMVGVAVMVGSFRDTVEVWVQNRLQADVFVRALDWTRDFASPIAPALVRKVEATPGIGNIVEFHAQPLLLDGRRTYIGCHWERNPASGERLPLSDPRIDNYRFLSGASAAHLLPLLRRGEALASEPFARQFHVTRGETVTVPTPAGPQRVRVAGVFYDYSSSEGELVIGLGTWRRWFGEPSVTSISLFAAPGVGSAELRRRVQRQLAAGMDGRVQVSINDNASLRAEILRIFDQTFRITWGLELIALVVAILGVANTLLAVALERRRELAILRFLGSTSRQTRRMLLAESGLIGVLAIAVGSVMGALLAVILINVINVQSFGWTIQVHIPWAFLVLAALLVLAATVAAGWGPARVARKLDALRAVGMG